MSIQSEITRISGNIADALDAIEEKGVTIPAGSSSDDLADLIGQITSGCTVRAATATPSSDSDSLSFTVNSSMSGLPKIFSCAPGLAGTTNSLGTGKRYIMSLQYNGSVIYGETVYRSSSSGTIYGYNDRYTVSRSGNTLTISETRTGMSSSLYSYFKSGLVYRLVYAY